MTTETTHLLKVFLCHASGDKPPVRELYKRLTAEGVDAWLDQEKLLPGQDWRLEIPRAVQEADVVVVCLSKKSITKEGYVQKEIKFALDIAEEKPEGTIFLIPARLEECVVPERLSRWQWVDLYEENGFIRLLRSLKLRADAVGAVIEPTQYEDTDKEREKRLKQFYTEGLAAFYTEDWDRACQRFQSILSEQPNHKNAAEKLAEADRQRNLSKLYEQASAAVRSEDWGTAIQTLEELSEKSANYKDTAQLLRNARKQRQLGELYAEAKALHEAQKWKAVVRVFEQIGVIEPNYSDPDGLLPSAQKEVAELKRLAELNDLYANAVEEMDAGNWYEARRLLESVHKSQTGFLETEKLLKKVEEEIAGEEEKRRQNDQVNTLYEQAHGLLRSKKWHNALDKMEEIRKLDEGFPDVDGIAEKAQKELAREEQEAERQNKLAALYAEAVRLLKEEKYQEALDKWQEVKSVDPKYPDRQRVHNTARKALSKQVKKISTKPRFVMPKTLWIGLGGIVAIAVLVFAINQFGNGGNKTSLAPITISTDVVVENTAPPVPAATNVPPKTSTPLPAKPVPTQGGFPDPTMIDDFDNSKYDGSYNHEVWESLVSGPDVDSAEDSVRQMDGKMILSIRGFEAYLSLTPLNYSKINPTTPFFYETQVQLDESSSDSSAYLKIWIFDEIGYFGQITCSLFNDISGNQKFGCHSGKHVGNDYVNIINTNSIAVDPTQWHTIRIEMYPDDSKFNFYIDGNLHFSQSNIKDFWGAQFSCAIEVSNNIKSDTKAIGYFDNVRMGAIEDDPIVYDNFDDTSIDGTFDNSKWTYLEGLHYPDGSVYQEDGVLKFQQSGTEDDRYQFLQGTTVDYYPLTSAFFESALKLDPQAMGGDIQLGFAGAFGHVICGVSGSNSSAYCWCNAAGTEHIFEERISTQSTSWHFFRIEVVQPAMEYKFYIDGRDIGSCTLPTSTEMRSTWVFKFGVWMQSKNVIGYVDYVHIGILDETKSKSSLIPTTFSNPLFDGYRLDRCYINGDQCELPAANAWCRLIGYNKATKYDFDLDVGLTKIIGSSDICNDYCDAFKSITCE